jgi:uncharacterized protein YjbI with pentapeptide repeats
LGKRKTTPAKERKMTQINKISSSNYENIRYGRFFEIETSKDLQDLEVLLSQDLSALSGLQFYADLDTEKLHLSRCNLRGRDLSGLDLEGAILEYADLRGADIRGAHLEGASLEGADLRGADIRGAHLEGATLEGTRLERARL